MILTWMEDMGLFTAARSRQGEDCRQEQLFAEHFMHLLDAAFAVDRAAATVAMCGDMKRAVPAMDGEVQVMAWITLG